MDELGQSSVKSEAVEAKRPELSVEERQKIVQALLKAGMTVDAE
jgi:hypothetical protein